MLKVFAQTRSGAGTAGTTGTGTRAGATGLSAADRRVLGRTRGRLTTVGR